MNQLVRWNPFDELENMSRQMTTLFDPQSESRNGNGSRPETYWAPLVDVFEDEHGYIFKAELPEVKTDDVNVQIENGVLVLSGERKAENEQSIHKYHRLERAYGAFSRSFELPDDADANQVSAMLKDGILTVTVAKSEHAKPRKIDVRVA
jgi:HSP20 family protein